MPRERGNACILFKLKCINTFIKHLNTPFFLEQPLLVPPSLSQPPNTATTSSGGYPGLHDRWLTTPATCPRYCAKSWSRDPLACPTVLILIMLFQAGIQEILGPLARDNIGRVRTSNRDRRCGRGVHRRYACFQMHTPSRWGDCLYRGYGRRIDP